MEQHCIAYKYYLLLPIHEHRYSAHIYYDILCAHYWVTRCPFINKNIDRNAETIDIELMHHTVHAPAFTCNQFAYPRGMARPSWPEWLIKYQDGVHKTQNPQTVTEYHSSTSWAQCSATTLVETNALPLCHKCHMVRM